MFHSGEMVPVCASIEEARSFSLLSREAFMPLHIWGFPQVNGSTHNLHTRFTCAHTSSLLRERAKKLQNKSGSWYDWNESKQIIFEHIKNYNLQSQSASARSLDENEKSPMQTNRKIGEKFFSVALRSSRSKNFPPFV